MGAPPVIVFCNLRPIAVNNPVRPGRARKVKDTVYDSMVCNSLSLRRKEVVYRVLSTRWRLSVNGVRVILSGSLSTIAVARNFVDRRWHSFCVIVNKNWTTGVIAWHKK
jgi:hypothetical protein